VAGVSRYEDLIVWQLANELQRGVFALTATGPASRDFKFRDQIRDASSSAPRNIAEGFGRFADAEFATFLRIARGSLMETHNTLRDGHDRGYFSADDKERCQHLAVRAMKAAAALVLYLDPPDGKRPRRKAGRFPGS
jgi:four helix bundle protein